MRRIVCAVVALAMLIAGVAWAEEEELHLLWGIEFGQDIQTVQKILKDEKGLDIELRGDDFLYYNEKEAEEAITILGYPVRSLGWTAGRDSRHEYVAMQFVRKITELFDGSSQPLEAILNALVEQFGSIDFAVYEIYGSGGNAETWQTLGRDNTHEVGHFTNLAIEALSVKSLMESKDYITEDARISIMVFIDNILIQSVFDFLEEDYKMGVMFWDSVYEDTYEDVFEEFKVEQPVQYEDTGF